MTMGNTTVESPVATTSRKRLPLGRTAFQNAVSKCPEAFNGLNARQSEIFAKLPLKVSFKLLDGIQCFF